MDNIALMAKVNDAAHLPENRKDLFKKIEKRDLEAFEILYELYFGITFKGALHPIEREVMQKMVAQFAESVFFSRPGARTKKVIRMMMPFAEPPPIDLLDRMLDWFNPREKVKDKNLRRIAASALLKFLPKHPGVHYKTSFNRSVAKMKLDGDTQKTRDDIAALIEAMKNR